MMLEIMSLTKKYASVSDASRIYLLPNLFTAANLFCGFLSIIRCIQARYSVQDEFTIHRYYQQAVWLIFIAGLSDMLDGRVARLKKKESLFGMEFDSICDMVSFGVAPALMVFLLILSPTGEFSFFRQVGWLFGFIYLLCAGIRLARFNVITSPLLPKDDSYPSYDFLGLPVPAAAGVVASFVLIINSYDLNAFAILIPPVMLFIAYLMVSNIRFPSFKKINWNTRTRLSSFVVIIGVLATISWFHEFSCAIVFLSYIIYGVMRHIRQQKSMRRYANCVLTQKEKACNEYRIEKSE
ncbi:MAG: CDP-diacylglycerol--serine O-phosphatidyltransferase [Puniceicoccales bacterium]|jgi:CDP-diacylglycerol--serine O-phosphatidyltransferase|nr:CDP-diacylglycerol--serine O-phosphatidyltransferase [Puniceicoccales bacterium]